MSDFDAAESSWLLFPGSDTNYIPPMKEHFAFCADDETGILYLHGGIDLTGKGGRSAKLVQFDFRRAMLETGSWRRSGNDHSTWRNVKFAAPKSSSDSAPKARSAHAIAIDKGSLYLFGGEGSFADDPNGGSASNSARHIFGDFFRFDIATRSWHRFPSGAPSARRGHTLTRVTMSGCDDAFLVVFGGCGPDPLYRQDVFQSDCHYVSLQGLGSDPLRSEEIGAKSSVRSQKSAVASSNQDDKQRRREPEWSALKIIGPKGDDDDTPSLEPHTKIEEKIFEMIADNSPCPRAGHTMT